MSPFLSCDKVNLRGQRTDLENYIYTQLQALAPREWVQ